MKNIEIKLATFATDSTNLLNDYVTQRIWPPVGYIWYVGDSKSSFSGYVIIERSLSKVKESEVEALLLFTLGMRKPKSLKPQ